MTLKITSDERMDLIHCVSSMIYRNETYIGNLSSCHTNEAHEAIETYKKENERLAELKKKIIFEVKM